jgi:hypothetical protein
LHRFIVLLINSSKLKVLTFYLAPLPLPAAAAAAAEELYALYSSLNYLGDQIKKNEIGGMCSMYKGLERCIQCFSGEIFLGRLRCRWKGSIKMDLQEVGWGVVIWIALAQDRERWRVLVNAVMNLWVP